MRKLKRVYEKDAIVVIIEPVEIEGKDALKQFYFFTPEEKYVSAYVSKGFLTFKGLVKSNVKWPFFNQLSSLYNYSGLCSVYRVLQNPQKLLIL